MCPKTKNNITMAVPTEKPVPTSPLRVSGRGETPPADLDGRRPRARRRPSWVRSLVSGGTSSGNPPPTRQMAGCGTRDFRAPWDPRAGRRLITAPRNPCSFHQLVGEPVPRRLDPLEQDQVLSLTTAVDGLHGEVDVMAAPAHRRRTAAYLSYLRANKS
jgi:hypothetical protein